MPIWELGLLNPALMSEKQQFTALILGFMVLTIASSLLFASKSEMFRLYGSVNLNSYTQDDDFDGLSNQFETSHIGTDPNNPDTDGDGAKDGFEFFLRKSDPLN